MPVLGSWVKNETGSVIIYLGSGIVKTLVNWSTSKRQISCLSFLKELVSRFIRGPMSVLQILNFLAYLKYSPTHTPTMSDKSFNILQWNANGIGNKQTEPSIFLEAHNIKVAAIQESKLTAKSRSPNIQNYTLVRNVRRQ